VSVRSIVGRRTTKLSVLAAGALVALTGCGSVHPGTAAVVGDTTISRDQVDLFADAICVVGRETAKMQGQSPPAQAMRGIRDQSLQVWVEGEINLQFGRSVGAEIDQQQLNRAMESNGQFFRLLSADEREAYEEAVRTFVQGQLMLLDVGRQELGESAEDQEALTAGEQQRREFVKDLDIEIDPRYGTVRNLDNVVAEDGSLSVPASPQARAASRGQGSPDYVAQLPASQQCG
jgi:hypothetical protein